ncbi:hypothetical protein VSS37_13505 [Candidatus Thiothrix sp. Deng01]|uniref:Uncharacterized protein n=1 Tax=Candidatus Thiothrix phosphatis TaxID=3112415 RepID=A0ABU6CYX9_9GAMM|nr:hypothetical protein [Candidatus Thiothrix sp. Deng01]MEB4592004.1 hypothetical protein [Candidatus Thiothrix sp. Deng01]
MPRQPGTPKTGGRVAGTRNKATAAVKAVAGSYTTAAIETLAEIMQDGTAPPAARVSAANALLDRGHGKPMQSSTVDATVTATTTLTPERFEQICRELADEV